jgi:hypothetical protein
LLFDSKELNNCLTNLAKEIRNFVIFLDNYLYNTEDINRHDPTFFCKANSISISIEIEKSNKLVIKNMSHYKYVFLYLISFYSAKIAKKGLELDLTIEKYNSLKKVFKYLYDYIDGRIESNFKKISIVENKINEVDYSPMFLIMKLIFTSFKKIIGIPEILISDLSVGITKNHSILRDSYSENVTRNFNSQDANNTENFGSILDSEIKKYDILKQLKKTAIKINEEDYSLYLERWLNYDNHKINFGNIALVGLNSIHLVVVNKSSEDDKLMLEINYHINMVRENRELLYHLFKLIIDNYKRDKISIYRNGKIPTSLSHILSLEIENTNIIERYRHFLNTATSITPLHIEKIEEKNIKNLSISSLFIRDSNGVLVEIPYNSLINFIKPILQDSMKIIPEPQEKNEELDFGINNIKEKIEKV